MLDIGDDDPDRTLEKVIAAFAGISRRCCQCG